MNNMLDLPDDPTRARAVLEEASRSRVTIVFKRSPICPISTSAERRFNAWLEGRHGPPLAVAVIDVLARKPLARGLVAALDVVHESPQCLVFREGRLTWHGSHEELTGARFAEVVDEPR